MFATHTATPLSFAARSAIAAWHITHDTNRLRRMISEADLAARNERGQTLVDIYMARGDRRAVEALRSIGAHRTIH